MVEVLSLRERTRMNNILRPYGLEVDGMSKEKNSIYVTIKKGSAVTYNIRKVAQVLHEATNLSRVILDGRVFDF